MANMDTMTDSLRIVSNDGHAFTLPRCQFMQSEYLTEQAAIDDDGVVEMFSMDATTLAKIVQFFAEHEANPIPVADIEHSDPLQPDCSAGTSRRIPKVCMQLLLVYGPGTSHICVLLRTHSP